MGKLKHLLDKVDNAAKAVAKQADEASSRISRLAESGALTVGDLFPSEPELADVRQVPVRVSSSNKEMLYDRFKNEIRVPDWAIANREIMAEEAFHALQNKRGQLTLDRMADDLTEINVTPELKIAYENIAEIMLRAGVPIDDIPEMDVLRFADSPFNVAADMAREVGRYTNDDDLLLGAERAVDNFNAALEGNYRLADEVLHSSPVEMDAANFAKALIARETGSIDPQLLAPTAAAAGIALAAQNYDYGTPEIDAAYREFAQRRAAKRDLWSQLKSFGEFGATVGSAIAGGVVGDLSRLGGYLNPAMPVEATEAGARAIEDRMQYIPSQPNAMLEGFGNQMNQFVEDVEPLAAPFRQSIPYKAYEALPERAQGIVRIASDLAF
jgi:hypothetical protein